MLRPKRDRDEGLRDAADRVQAFLSQAQNAPAPVPVEEYAVDGDNDVPHEGAVDHGDTHIEMDLLLGVLEAREPRGILLPTAANAAALHEEQQREAEAMLNMVAALRQARPDGDGDDGAASSDTSFCYDSDSDGDSD